MQDDFDDDDDDFMHYRLVESKPVTWFTFLQFFFSIVVGFLRTLTESVSDLSDSFVGAEGHYRSKKVFQDQARIEIDSIAEGISDEE